MNWVLPPGLSARALGGVFKIDWVCKGDLSFTKVQHLYNPWNEGKPVKIGRDGQEIQPKVGEELGKLFPEDKSADLTPILRKSKEAARKHRSKGSVAKAGPLGGRHRVVSSSGGRGRESGRGRGGDRGRGSRRPHYDDREHYDDRRGDRVRYLFECMILHCTYLFSIGTDLQLIVTGTHETTMNISDHWLVIHPVTHLHMRPIITSRLPLDTTILTTPIRETSTLPMMREVETMTGVSKLSFDTNYSIMLCNGRSVDEFLRRTAEKGRDRDRRPRRY